MNAKEFVDSLFEGYEETAALADFKEELLANLNAKIESLIKKGMDAQTAFEKASAELGDVSTFADELSLKKRTEVFEEVYMDMRQYMSGPRVAGYVVFGALALFGIIVACIALFAAKTVGLNSHLDRTAFFGALMPFLTTAAAGFTFLGITQETASMYPVSKKRGAWYAVAAGLLTFGFTVMPVVYFGIKFAGDIVNEWFGFNFESLIPLVALLIPFVLPGIGILVYMVFTEKDRLKPWAKNFRDKAASDEIAVWSDPATAARFGLYSGAIWIIATGVFVLLGFLIGFKYSWLAFIFATAVQLLVQAMLSRKTA